MDEGILTYISRYPYKFNECIVIIGEPTIAILFVMEGSKTQWHIGGHTDTPNSRGSSGPKNC